MRTGVRVEVSAADRPRLEAIVADRNSPQKHVWREQVVFLTADGCGTAEIMRGTGRSKTAVWRWQERFMAEGIAGLLRDKTRPPRIAPLSREVEAGVVAATRADPPAGRTHWTAAAMAEMRGISVTSLQRIWRRHGLQPHRSRQFKLSNDPQFAAKVHDIVGLYVDPPDHAVVLSNLRRRVVAGGYNTRTHRCCHKTLSAVDHLSGPTLQKSLHKPLSRKVSVSANIAFCALV